MARKPTLPDIRFAPVRRNALHPVLPMVRRSLLTCRPQYDARQCRAIVRLLAQGWRRDGHPRGRTLAWAGNRVVGLSQGWGFRLHWLFVDPEFMGRGLGGALAGHAIRHAREGLTADVAVSSGLNAEGFYRRLGFVRHEGLGEVTYGRVALPVVHMLLPGSGG